MALSCVGQGLGRTCPETGNGKLVLQQYSLSTAHQQRRDQKLSMFSSSFSKCMKPFFILNCYFYIFPVSPPSRVRNIIIVPTRLWWILRIICCILTWAHSYIIHRDLFKGGWQEKFLRMSGKLLLSHIEPTVQFQEIHFSAFSLKITIWLHAPL